MGVSDDRGLSLFRTAGPLIFSRLRGLKGEDQTEGGSRGTRALPDQVRLNLALAQEHKFGSGTVYLCYRPA